MECPACDSPLTGQPERCATCGQPLGEMRLALRQLRVMGTQLAFIPLAYLALILVTRAPALDPAQAGHLRIVEYLFWGVSAVLAALVIFWPEPAASFSPKAARRQLMWQSALAEPPALLGVVLHFLGAPRWDCLAFVAGSLILCGFVALRLPRLASAIRRYFVEKA